MPYYSHLNDRVMCSIWHLELYNCSHGVHSTSQRFERECAGDGCAVREREYRLIVHRCAQYQLFERSCLYSAPRARRPATRYIQGVHPATQSLSIAARGQTCDADTRVPLLTLFPLLYPCVSACLCILSPIELFV